MTTSAPPVAPLREAHPALEGGGLFYFAGDDNFRLQSINSLASVTLALTGRFLRPDGTIEAFQHNLTPASDRTLSSANFPRGEGWLIGVRVVVTGAAPIVGQTWVQLDVIRGLSGAVVALHTLMAGYVTATQALVWPAAAGGSSLEGQGAIRSITGADPAAGVEISETVPTGVRWRLLAVHFVLVTDATVANRVPSVVLDDGAVNFSRTDSGAVQAASLSIPYSAFPGAGFSTAVGSSRHIPIPNPTILLGGFRIRTLTNAIVAGDNYGAPQLLVEEFFAG